MIHHLQFAQWVPVALERVFLFFANPTNLPWIMPQETRTVVVRLNLVPPPGIAIEPAAISDLAGAGSEIVTSFRMLSLLPYRTEWSARITEFEWNQHFADLQKKGPFRSFQHRHEFGAETRNGVNGTVVRDLIDYEVGFGLLGELAQKLFIRRQLQLAFAHRQQALEKLLGEPRQVWREPSPAG